MRTEVVEFVFTGYSETVLNWRYVL